MSAQSVGTLSTGTPQEEVTAGTRTVGVEEEFLLVDPHTGRTVPIASALLQSGTGPDTEDEHVEAELQEQQLETRTDPHARLAALREGLIERRLQADEIARTAGARIVALATAPLPVTPITTPAARYQRMAQRYGPIEQSQLSCGCHVHVAVASDDEAVTAIDRIRGWLAPLVALTSNSPFYGGEDTSYASFRTQLWSRWPSTGPIEVVHTPKAYEELVTQVLATGSAMDRGMVYFDARLSESYPTVEVRVADVCLDVDDAVLMAALVRGLVDSATAEWVDDEPIPVAAHVLRGAGWRASRFGLSEELYHPVEGRSLPASEVVHDLYSRIRPALDRYGDADWVGQRLEHLLRDGNGADHQRTVYGRTGSLEAVVADAVEVTTRQP
ncbi:carboxylate-amine ligase [Luteipulveratus flavus]|nr:glutamate--cysteine ligase [Luteipulveratus sp. YIM 133132]